MANAVERWVEEQARLTKPEKVYWVQGTQEEMRRLVETASRKRGPAPTKRFGS